ncbi:DUF721 domain-containing protein [bacterium]|nr:DUF721 domain-containing protein [bacterium]
MIKKSIYTDFIDIGSILESFKNSPEMKKAIKRKTLFSMWENAVGKKFAKKSRPYSQRLSTLVVTCQNSAIAQELLLRKAQILKKLEPYLKGLKMNIKDIYFDTKRWVEEED